MPDTAASTLAAESGFDSTLPAFGADSALRTDIAVHSRGMQGTELPYIIRNDSNLTIVLLAALMLMLVALAAARPVMGQRLKELFSSKEGDDSGLQQQPLFMHLLALINCMLLAVTAFVMASRMLPESFVEKQHLLLVAVLFAVFCTYFIAKFALYTLVNNVFFGTKKSRQWNSCLMTILDFEAVMLMPMVMLLVFSNITTQNAFFYLVLVLFLNKMLAFYKAWCIFFREKSAYMQIFLYFCALEIMPLLALGGEVLINVNENKVFF